MGAQMVGDILSGNLAGPAIEGLFPTPEKVNAMVDGYLAPLYLLGGADDDFRWRGRPPAEFRWQYGPENPMTLNDAEAGQWYLMSSSPLYANYRLLYLAENDQAGNWKLLTIDKAYSPDERARYTRTPTKNRIGYLGSAYDGNKKTWNEWIWSSMDGWSKIEKGHSQAFVKSQIGIINWRW